jgi:hypothetical protein
MDWLHRVKPIVHRSASGETAMKPFFRAAKNARNRTGAMVHKGLQKSTGIIMMAVLTIAAVVEIAILVVEITTRAKLVAKAFSSGRVRT